MNRLGIGIAGCVFAIIAVSQAADDPSHPGSLQIAVDRQLVHHAESAAEHLARGETARALPLLERLWLESPAALVGKDPVLESSRDCVIRLLQQIPAGERHLFWNRIEAAAGDEADEILRGAPTRAGLSILWRTANRLRDHADFDLAAAAFAEAARHPSATPGERLLAEIQRLDLLERLHGPGELIAWRSSADADLLRNTIRWGDKTISVEDWIQQRISASKDVPLPATELTDRPAGTPTWRHAVDSPANLITGLEEAGDELRAEGVIRLPATPPRIIGSRVVYRTPTGLECRDLDTGERRWSLKDRVSTEGTLLATQHQHPLYRQKLLSGVMQRLQTNTLSGAMSHDESTVYRVIEAESPAKPQDAPVVYVLEAVDVTTGQPKWRIGGERSAKDEFWRFVEWSVPPRTMSDPMPVVSINGPPLALGEHLYFLGKTDGALWMYRVHRNHLQVDWAVRLCEFPADADRGRLIAFTGSTPFWTGSLLICPTGSGVIVAVDPVRQSVRWMVRTPVEGQPRIPGDSTYADLAAAKTALQAWRETAIFHSPGRLIVSSPESQFAHVLEEATGRMLSAIPRNDGLNVLGMSGEHVVILEPAAIRAHDITTGILSWRTVIEEIRGQGMIAGDRVIQPLAAGSIAVLDLKSGRRLPGAIQAENRWGRLIRTADGWINADEFHIAKYPDLATLRLRLRDEMSPGEQARLAYESGDFAAARQLLISREDLADRRLLLDVDLAELKFAPSRREMLQDEFRKLASGREENAEVLASLAEAALKQGDRSQAVALSLEGLDLGVIGERRIRGESVRVVRWDRVFSGLIAAALNDVGEDERRNLEKLLSAHWQTARNAGDPFTLQQLYQRSRGLPWTRREFLSVTPSVFLGSRLLAQELSLRDAAKSGNWQAWDVLRQEWRAAGFPRDAEDIERHLLQSAPGELLDGKLTVRESMAAGGADLGRLQRRLAIGPADVWPTKAPRVTETKDFFDDAYQTPIPISADPNSVWDRLDVTLDRQGRTLRFTGDDRPGSWTLALPRSSSPLPYTDRGWGIGRLLIVRIGSRLLAVTPFDEHGAAVANLLWSLELRDVAATQSQGFLGERVVSRWKRAGEDEFRIRDTFGRDFAPVGPVLPGYLCVQRQGKLAAIETQTGQQLWERWDVAPGTITLGDNEHVLLWQPDRQTVEVLAAVDGRTLHQSTCNFMHADVWHDSGCQLWIGQIGLELELRCIDLARDRTLWRRNFPKGCLPIALDERTAGVIDPRGLLHLLDLVTGDPLDEALTVEVPQPLEKVILSRDETRWYLGLSGPSPRSLDWQQVQPLHGFRRPLLNGPLYALNRSSRQVVWRRSFDGEPWLLDQNQSSPVLVQSFKTPPPSGQGIGEGVLKLIDKRTGQDVFTHRDINLLPNFSLEPYMDNQSFELRTERTAFQFDYGLNTPN